MSTDYEGEMLWYEGPGVYQDGIKIAEMELNSVLELLLEHHGYVVVRVNDSTNPQKEAPNQ